MKFLSLFAFARMHINIDDVISLSYLCASNIDTMFIDMAENEEFLNEMRKEKFDLALHHHLDSCTLGVVNVLQVNVT